MSNMTVTKLGGNQFEVSNDKETKTIDLDGLDVISNEDYQKISEAGLDNDLFIAPMHSDGDEFWEEAVNYAVNYSSFDVEEYIMQNKE